MKKRKLVIDYDFDFDAYGIVSSAKGYKLAWELNRRLGIHLVKQPDLTVGFRNKLNRGFTHYSFETHVNRLKLLRNRPAEGLRGKHFLTPEFPHFDYIVLATMQDQRSDVSLMNVLKEIPSVALVSPFALDELKSKANFVF